MNAEAITQIAREHLRAAVEAGRQGDPVGEDLAREIAIGSDAPLSRLGFDSLGWMEFCISVEATSGLELTPGDVADMVTLRDVETWLTMRLRP